MDQTTKRLNADLYQPTGDGVLQEHIAASGNLSIAALFANHAQQATYGAPHSSEPTDTSFSTSQGGFLPTAASATHGAWEQASLPTNLLADTLSSLSQGAAATLGALGAPAGLLTPIAATPGSAAAAPSALSFFTSSSSSTSSVATATNGTDGTDGTDGSDGNNGHCAPQGDHCSGGGDTTITIDIDITNTSVTNLINLTNLIDIDITNTTLHAGDSTSLIDIGLISNTTVMGDDTTLIDIDLGGTHSITGNDNDLLDLGLGAHDSVAGNDNDLLSLNLLGSDTVGGDNNNLLDLTLGGNQVTGGNDNDLIDLNLLNEGTTGGNDNNLLDLGLGSQHTTQGNDNDLIDLGLNDHGSQTGTDHDLIDLDLNLLDSTSDASEGTSAIGGDLNLLDGTDVAGVDLSLFNAPLVDVSSGSGPAEASDAPVSLDIGGLDELLQGDLSGAIDNLSLDANLGDLGTGIGQGDSGLLDALGLGECNPIVNLDHGNGTVLGLHLSLSPWA